MEKILEQSYVLLDIIKESTLYREYLQYKNKINEDSFLKEKLFNLKNIQLENYIDTEVENNFDNEKRMSNLYTPLILNEDIHIFLEKEKNLLELLETIKNNISSTIILDFW